MKEAYRAAEWKSVQSQRVALIRPIARDIRRILSNEHKEMMKAVAAASHGSLDAAIERVIKDQVSVWEKYLPQLYLKVGRPFAKTVLRQLGIKELAVETKDIIDVWQQRVMDWLEANGGDEVVGITEAQKKAIRKAVEEGIGNGESIPDIATRVDQLYLKAIIPNRSVTIARTETIRASNVGRREAAGSTGLQLEKEWIATRDNRTRSDHADADGQVVPYDDPYDVGGEALMFPGDPAGSPGNVINCRCTEGYSRVGD